MDKVHTGIGDRLSVFFQWITAFITGIVIGFIYEWRLALIILGIAPFMVVTATFYVKVS